MKKILVISENVALCSFLQGVCNDFDLTSTCSFDFRYTSYNDNPKSMIEIGASEINVKDDQAVEWIVHNYDIVFSIHCKQIFHRPSYRELRALIFILDLIHIIEVGIHRYFH